MNNSFEKQQKESQERWERSQRESQQRWERSRREREKAYQESRVNFDQPRETEKRSIFSRLFRRHVKVDYDYSDFDSQSYFEDLLNRVQASTETLTDTKELSPAEQTRRTLMTTLPAEKVRTLTTCDETNVRNFIATVHNAREVNPERTDWDIYLAYRRSIEVENPDPAMVEKTQIAGLLLEGNRKEARFPF